MYSFIIMHFKFLQYLQKFQVYRLHEFICKYLWKEIIVFLSPKMQNNNKRNIAIKKV